MTTAARYLVDTGVFILYFRNHDKALAFFRETPAEIYYSRVTRKELLHPPIRAREEEEIVTFLRKYRIITTLILLSPKGSPLYWRNTAISRIILPMRSLPRLRGRRG